MLTGVGVWFAVDALVTFYYVLTPVESSLGTRGLMLAPQLLLFSLLAVLLAVLLALRAHRRGARLASSIFALAAILTVEQLAVEIPSARARVNLLVTTTPPLAIEGLAPRHADMCVNRFIVPISPLL